MGDFMIIKVDNSKKSAIQKGKWKDPGARLYDRLLNAVHCDSKVPNDKDEFDKAIKEGKYYGWDKLLQEAYAVAPVKEIANNPHGKTPFSRSGCKYPHHVIKGDKLVVSIPGLRAAYICARNQGVLVNHTPENKKIVAHFNRHFRELGLKPVWHHGEFYLMEEHEVKIEQNFNDIYLYLQETTGIDLFDQFIEASHGKLKYDFRKVYDFNTGHALKLVYSLDGIKIHDIGSGYLRQHPEEDRAKTVTDIQKNIKRKGNLDHLSSGQKVLAIIDRVTGENLKEADVIGPFAPAVNNTQLSIYNIKDLQEWYHNKGQEFMDRYIYHIKVGIIDNNATFKTTHWFSNDTAEEKLRGGHTYKSDNTILRGQMGEGLKYGRGRKLDDMTGTMVIGSKVKYSHPSNKDIRRDPELYREHLTDEEFERLMKNKTPEEVKEDIEAVKDEIKNVQNASDSPEKKNLIAILRANLKKLIEWLRQLLAKLGRSFGLLESVLEDLPYELRDGIIVESTIEGTPENPVLSSEFNDEVGDTTPQALYEWMHENIKYDKTIVGWKLRNAAQLYLDKKGNCHDQSYFESLILHSWGYSNWQLFFVEFSDNSNIGGNTHSLTYYKDGENLYWFENAWEDQAGIHGPFKSVDEIKQAVYNIYLKDNDINSGEFDGIVFGTYHNYQLGMTLGEYVESWTLDDDRRFIKDTPEITADVKKSTNPNDPESQEAVDITFFNKEGDKIGEASISAVDTNNGFLYNVEVLEWYRGQGYGKAIIEYCLSHYKINELTVEPTNTTAIELYKKYGFKKYMDWEENGRKLIDMRRNISNEIKEATEWIDRFVHDEVFRESADVTSMADLIRKYKTPEELNEWMKCIQYGWKDKSGKINGTGDNDETSHLFEEYRLQSPNQLIKSKTGLCWDCVELERQWFEHSQYPYAIIFIEVRDGDNCPTHVTLIYKKPGEHNEIYWFESSWGEARGIREFKDLETGLPQIVDEIIESFNTEGEKIIRILTKPMPTGTTCEEYYDLAHNSTEIDMGDLFYDEIFAEYTYMETKNHRINTVSRLAINIANGHSLRIIYDMDNTAKIHKSHDIVADKDLSTLRKYGDTNFKSSGHIVKAILDLDDNRRELESAETIGPIVNLSIVSQNDIRKPDYLRRLVAEYKLPVNKVTVGKIDQSATFKTTYWPKLPNGAKGSLNDYIAAISDIKDLGIKGYSIAKLKDFDTSTGTFLHPRYPNIQDSILRYLLNQRDELKLFISKRERQQNELIALSKQHPGPDGSNYRDRLQICNNELAKLYAKLDRIINDIIRRRRQLRSRQESVDIGNKLIEEKYTQADVLPNHTGYTMETLPRIMYFASRNKHPTVQNERVFLTPYIGIASLFIIDNNKNIAEEFKKQTGRYPERLTFNTSFREWEMENQDLVRPLKKAHITHNIAALDGVTIKGTSKGYIHCIDITDIRGQLKLFSSKDPNREVYYDGGHPLKPVEIIEHSIKYELTYSEVNAKHHGQGILERADVIPKENDLQWMNEYLCEASQGKLKVDHRLAIDNNTGHKIHIIYSLDGIIITKNIVNGFMDTVIKGQSDVSKDEVSKLKRYGNTNHESYNQKVLAIIDMYTGEHLRSASVRGPFGYGGKFDIKVGEVDMSPSFKSTYWGAISNSTGAIADRETIGRMRGVKGRQHELLGVNNIRSLEYIRQRIINAPKESAAKRKETLDIAAKVLTPEQLELLAKTLPGTSEEIAKLKAEINEIYRKAGHTNVMGKFKHQQESYSEGGDDWMAIIDMDERILMEDGSDEPIPSGKTQDDIEAEQEAAAKKQEEFVPIYGIVKSYSRDSLRNDGTEKTPEEMKSANFDKIINKLTRGDNYSHALVSFDDSLTHMYSYEDEGFVVDNIMERDSWMGTKSIYICVMFVRKSERDQMMRFVQELIDHKDETRYASANLLKAYVGTPYKTDRRFVCSSFTGYIMSCANPKNLHRDFSRLRPEDITILPRAFYVMNVVDRADFLKHRSEIQSIVKTLYSEFKEEIDDYNNHLPKLMLKNRYDKLKTLDKIFDWIIDRL